MSSSHFYEDFSGCHHIFIIHSTRSKYKHKHKIITAFVLCRGRIRLVAQAEEREQPFIGLLSRLGIDYFFFRKENSPFFS